MALKEYRLNGGTHLFDSDNVPDGAELVGDIAESVSPGSFEELVMAAHDKRGKRGRKAAPAPENKAEPESHEDKAGEPSTETPPVLEVENKPADVPAPTED